MKKITIKKLYEVDFLTTEANEIIEKFNKSKQHLELIVFEGYEDCEVEDILEEGMYSYKATPEIEEILNELIDIARPIIFDEADILAVAEA